MVRSNSHVRGFALVEMVAVIALLGLFSSWFVPIIYSAREAARMATCVDNLRKIGVAASSYHETHGQFPPGVVANTRLETRFFGIWPSRVQQMVGVHLFLSPYYDGGEDAFEIVEEDLGTLEVDYYPDQGELQPFWAADNDQAWEVAHRQFPQLICPSVGPAPPLERMIVGSFYGDDNTVNVAILGDTTLGRTDYLGCSGFWGASSQQPSSIDGRPFSDFAGVFGIRTKTSLKDITDGASKTYLFGEAPGENGENLGAASDLDGHFSGNAWISNATLSTVFGFDPSIFNESGSEGQRYRAHWAGFASLHPVVIHWLYADGSTHALSKATDKIIYRNMAGFADGGAGQSAHGRRQT